MGACFLFADTCWCEYVYFACLFTWFTDYCDYSLVVVLGGCRFLWVSVLLNFEFTGGCFTPRLVFVF